MTLLEAAVLGVVQGLTEFLPISSSAHLRVVPAMLGWQDPGTAFSAVIQLGSVLAVFSYFWADLSKIFAGTLKALKDKDLAGQDLKILLAIIVGTIPVCLFGLVLMKLLEQDNGPFRSLYVIGAASIFMGLFLLCAEWLGKRSRGIENLGVKDGLLVGLGQSLALIPGCSRSGSTLTVALLLNLKRQDAARFSFLLGLPAITLAGLVELKHLFASGLNGGQAGNLIVGLVSSTIVSYISIAWLIKYLQKHSTIIFVFYRLVFGAAIIGLALNHLIN